ncbi:uncharacterized protein LOC124420159 [Lucilia cuprina]|uniref:uncharacterized protein LOC124420159 n=1 Tax=Lucilia cuprina TaxID=7375 RepID=UPI001F05176F|nr:uncharacterized protein LOC124420159 [Lucilia cuprina]XP_046808234.1 uncharacterized protein LOC124420159 [Lucilia cuprina]
MKNPPSCSGKMLEKSEIINRFFGRRHHHRRGCHSGLWPIAILYAVFSMQLFGSSMAFTILSPFSYTSLSFKNLLNSVLLSSNANLAGGGRNLKSDVLEDASLITVSLIYFAKL